MSMVREGMLRRAHDPHGVRWILRWTLAARGSATRSGLGFKAAGSEGAVCAGAEE